MRGLSVFGIVLILAGLLILYFLHGLLFHVIIVLLGVVGLIIGIILILVGLLLVFGGWRFRRVRRYFGPGTPTEI